MFFLTFSLFEKKYPFIVTLCYGNMSLLFLITHSMFGKDKEGKGYSRFFFVLGNATIKININLEGENP